MGRSGAAWRSAPGGSYSGGRKVNKQQNAGQAMYAAKEAGDSQFSFFTDSMQQAARQHLSPANGLRRALAARKFAVYPALPYLKPFNDFTCLIREGACRSAEYGSAQPCAWLAPAPSELES